jgi:caffeoyl-CoA O-methyltransferase
MAFKSIGLSDDLHAYLVAHNGPSDPLVADLIEQTRSTFGYTANFQIAPEQSPFLTFFVRLLGVKDAVEVGTFTGLSSLSIARGLADGGRLLCLDVSEEFTGLARQYWQKAGVADRIDLRLAPAAETLAGLATRPQFDFAFIDADKTGYPTYWAELVPRMRPGGVLVVDNVLRGGRVVAAEQDPETAAIVAFNEIVAADDRVESVMIPLADGLTIARVKP